MNGLPQTTFVRSHERFIDIRNEIDNIDQENTVHLEKIIGQHPETLLTIVNSVIVDGTELLLK